MQRRSADLQLKLVSYPVPVHSITNLHTRRMVTFCPCVQASTFGKVGRSGAILRRRISLELSVPAIQISDDFT